MSDTGQTEVIALGQAGVETSNFDRYKGRKNVTDRLAFVGQNLVRGFSYYHNKTRFLAPKPGPALDLCKKVLGEPDQSFALVVFHYLTNDEGDLIDEEKLQGKIKLWRWSESKYDEYSGLGKKWPIMDRGFDQPQNDLIIKCTEEQYQRMTTTPAPDAQWKKKEAWYKAIQAKVLLAQPKLISTIGYAKTDTEIMELLGASMGNPASHGDAADGVDLSDVIGD